jgi:hypothetical protein
MVRVAHGVPHPIGLAMWRAVCSVAPSCRVVACAHRARERSVARWCTVAQYCSACPHDLQVMITAPAHTSCRPMMSLTLGAMEM